MHDKSLLIDAPDLLKLVRHIGVDALMDTMIARLTVAIREYRRGSGQIPPRTGIQYETPEWGLVEWMPAHFDEGTTAKLVAYHPANPVRRRLPSVVSTICMFDAGSGHLRALLDGTLLTALRTGAASAVASRILASADSSTVGVIGCGAQAVTQLHALSRVFDITQVLAHDVDETAAASFGARVGFLDAPVTVVSRASLGELLPAADILCTCTSVAPGEGPVCPLFDGKPHLHINAVGSDFPGKWELPVSVLRRSLVCPDFREQAVIEGECQQLDETAIGPDLATLVQQPEQYADARTTATVFDSTGWALEDHVAATIILEYARELGIGRPLALECLPLDPRDPYSMLHEPAFASAVAARGSSRF
jgi:ornithine cyclodeaminase/alanine dehydrogenase-like protein (mu-crystallin family)